MALRCVSARPRSPFLFFIKVFFGLFLLILHPDFFLNITKLERLHRAASRAIIGFPLFSPISLLLFEVPLPPYESPPLAHFAQYSRQPALRLPTSFTISGLARPGVEPRIFSASWGVAASTHLLIFSSSRRFSLPALFFSLELFFFLRVAHSFLPMFSLFFLAKVRFFPFLTLSHHTIS